jgi:hypothetical protein
VRRRRSPGGGSPESVSEQIAAIRAQIDGSRPPSQPDEAATAHGDR